MHTLRFDGTARVWVASGGGATSQGTTRAEALAALLDALDMLADLRRVRLAS